MRMPSPIGLGLLPAAVVWLAVLPPAALAQEESPAATRQYAAAARLQNLKSYGVAAEQWQEFLDQFQADPRVDEASYNLGVCYYLDGKLDQALATFQRVVKQFPKSDKLEDAYLYLGATQYGIAKAGKTEMCDSAVRTFDTLLAKFSRGRFVPDALYFRGECLYMQGKRQEAADSYRQLIRGDPKHKYAADASYALGVCQQELNQHAEAGRTYETFLKSYSDHPLVPEVTLRWGETLTAGGQYGEAVKRFAAAASTAGFELADYAAVRQADCLAQMKRYAEAAAVYASVLSKFPGSQQTGRAALAGGKCYYLAGNYSRVRDLLEKVLGGGGPSASEAAHWLARSWLKQNQPARALEAVEKVLPQARRDKSPFLPQLLMDQADAVYEIPQRRKESIALYAALGRTYKDDPAAPQALYMAAFAALEHGENTMALEQADAFLAAHADHELVPDVSHIEAEGQLLLGRLAEAEKGYAELLRRHSDHPEAELWKVRRAVALRLQKKYRELVQALEPVLGEIRRPELAAEARFLMGLSQVELKQYGPAVKSLEASLAAEPKWRAADETLLALARAHAGLKDYEKAKSILGKLIGEFPKSSVLDAAHYRLGECYGRTGDFQPAATEFQRVIGSWPDSPLAPHAMHELGCTQIELGDDAAAEETLSILLQKYPQHALAATARFSRGMARRRLDKLPLAAEDLQAFLATGPPREEKSNARYLLGLCQTGLGQHEPAIATFQTLLREDAGYANADNVLYQLAWAMKLSGKETEAARTFGQLAADYPDSARAAEADYHVGDAAYEKKDYQQAALAYYRSMRKAGKSDLGERASHKLGWAYYHQKEFENALKTFRYQRATYPQGTLAPDAAFMEAECLFAQGKHREALSAYEQIGKLPDEGFQALALLHAGQAAGQLNEWKKSLQLLDRCARQFPDATCAVEAFYERGWAQQNLGDLDAAEKSYQRVIAGTASELAARAQFMIGEIQFGRKDHKEAVRSYFKVMAYGFPTWQAEATFEAARCFEVLGQSDQAVKLYRELVEKFPESDKVQPANKRIQDLLGNP